MKRSELENRLRLAAYQSWSGDGLNRGADPEVMEDIGVVTPEQLPEVIARTLERYDVIGLDETDGTVEKQPNVTRKPVPDTVTTRHLKDRNLEEAHYPNGKLGKPPTVPTEDQGPEPRPFSDETEAQFQASRASHRSPVDSVKAEAMAAAEGNPSVAGVTGPLSVNDLFPPRLRKRF